MLSVATDKVRTLVIGFGNPLMSDDGVGHSVVEELRRVSRSSLIRVEACAGDGLQLLDLWAGEARVWIVDALVRHAAPGSLHVLEHDEILRLPQHHESAHQLSLAESLRLITVGWPEMKNVRYRLWGVEPLSLLPGQTLSSEVAASVPGVAQSILCRFRGR